MRALLLAALSLLLLSAAPANAATDAPIVHAAGTCADYANQAAAQQAADTRDADGDGVYCESLPCPCSSAADGGSGGGDTPRAPAPAPSKPSGCSKPSAVQPIGFSKTKYPHIRAHFLAAVAKGWPRILVLNRPGAAARREKLLADIPTKSGYDRDEYPPALARGRGFHIRGADPKGWMADVAYVGSHENRSHGSTMETKLKRFCNGTKFRYVFY
jgi:hypothetical protein